MLSHRAHSSQASRDKGVDLLWPAAGCVAATAGFLLNFAINEAATASPKPIETQPSQVPLSPNQHRLTEDGEPDKSVVAGDLFVSNQQSSKNALVSNSTTSGSQAEQHIQAELGTTALQSSHQQPLPDHQSPAAQRVTAQVKVHSTPAAEIVCAPMCWAAFWHADKALEQLVASLQTLCLCTTPQHFLLLSCE